MVASVITVAFVLVTINVYNMTTSVSAYQHVQGDEILDENGRQVIWRGVGCSYLSSWSEDYMTAWQNHLPEIQAMGLNTIRLAFQFPFDNETAKDVLDYRKLDWVLSFLAKNNIKAILDNHGSTGFGSKALIDAWTDLASRYRGDTRIVAYELFNEPFWSTWDHASVKGIEDVPFAYANLTKEIRKVDPYHIHIWQSLPYLPPLDEITEFLQPNIVYTAHRWWTYRRYEFEIWTPEQLSNIVFDYIVEMRSKLHAPFWLGEFGGSGTYDDPSNPAWLIAEQLLYRCEEQAVGWNLWMGHATIWNQYLAFFPLKVQNPTLVHQPFEPQLLRIENYITDQHGVDWLESYLVEIMENNDFVTLRPGIIILVVKNHELQNGQYEIVSKEKIQVAENLTIYNEQFEPGHEGNWNTLIYALDFNS